MPKYLIKSHFSLVLTQYACISGVRLNWYKVNHFCLFLVRKVEESRTIQHFFGQLL